MDAARWRSSGPARDGQLGGALAQAVIVLAILGVLAFELVAVGVTAFAVDDASRQVARAARDAYRSSDGSLATAEQTADEAADVHRAEVTRVAIDGEDLTVTLTRRASTVLLHRLDATADLGVREATGRAPLEAT